jgi:hypothetical protein
MSEEDSELDPDGELQIVDLGPHEAGETFGIDASTYRRMASAALCAAADVLTIQKFKSQPGVVLQLFYADYAYMLSVDPRLISLQRQESLDDCEPPELLLTCENSVSGWTRIKSLMTRKPGT